MIIHIVQQGDTLYKIAQRYGVSIEKLVEDNQISYPDMLTIGQNIVIDHDMIIHTVVRGDTLYQLAKQYGTTVEDIVESNPQIANPDRISIGQRINIPVGVQKLGSMEVNGYVYDTVQASVLEKVLPNLTYISIFAYEVMSDGGLSTINDDWIIRMARQQRVAPLMTIVNIVEGEGFSSDLAHTILTDEAVQQQLISNVLNAMQSKNYYGLNVDFEYLYPEDREAYNAFLERVRQAIHPYGYILTTAVAPKISADQQGTLYEAHDYAAHGRIADRVIIMTYEWGYINGPPLPIAPIGPVRQVLDYAVTEIPPKKIMMGMPNYAYDWTLPYREGTSARILTNVEAVNLAIEKMVEIKYDQEAQAPFFEYTDQGVRHIVWFDNAQSIKARLQLVDEYGLAGVSYWTVNQYFSQNWLVQNALYDTIKVL